MPTVPSDANRHIVDGLQHHSYVPTNVLIHGQLFRVNMDCNHTRSEPDEEFAVMFPCGTIKYGSLHSIFPNTYRLVRAAWDNYFRQECCIVGVSEENTLLVDGIRIMSRVTNEPGRL